MFEKKRPLTQKQAKEKAADKKAVDNFGGVERGWGGRPKIEFKQEYCTQLEDHMRQGLTIYSFGAVINVGSQTVMSWLKKYPEFKDAKERGETKLRKFDEQLHLKISATGVGHGASHMFTLKNRYPDHYRERKEVIVTSSVDVRPIIEQFTKEQCLAAIAILETKLIAIQKAEIEETKAIEAPKGFGFEKSKRFKKDEVLDAIFDLSDIDE